LRHRLGRACPRFRVLAMQEAVLIATSGPLAGRKFPVRTRVSIGRGSGNYIQLASAQVSRKHAIVEKRGDSFALTDLGSRNGTSLNGKPVQSHLLHRGDRISIDEYSFDFIVEDSDSCSEGGLARVVDIPQLDHAIATEIEVASTLPRPLREAPPETDGSSKFQKTYQILLKASEAFGLEHDLSSLFGKILDYIFEVIPAHRGVIFVKDEDSAEFKLVAGKERAFGLTSGIEVSRTLLNKAAEQGKAILTTNAAEDTRFQASQSIPLHDIRSAMCVPMIHGGELQGTVYLDTIGVVEEFDARGLELLVAISGPAAIAIKNARYLTELNRRSKQLKKSYYDTLKVVVDSLEMRDYYTIGHGQRVALFAKIIAEEMGRDQEQLRLVEMGGILHDLGKIGIEDAILRKKAELTEAEIEQMEFHPEIGARIVRDADFLSPVLPYILYHHERYDGSGHPYHLKGEEIPIEGRLMAVADAFDAMTTDRPYRNGMNAEQAIPIIQEESERQFDPQVVEAFLRAWEKGRINKAMLSSAQEVRTVECPYCSSKIKIRPDSLDHYLIHCPTCHKRARL